MPVLAPLQASGPALPRAARATGARMDRPAGDRLLIRIGLLVGLIVLVFDQATKELAASTLFRGRLVNVLGDGWGWQLTYNDGGAFGFPAPSYFFLAVTVVVAVIVVRNLPHVQAPASATAYGLLMAGALGNALDRVFRTGDPGDPRFLHGHVVDFVAVQLPGLGPFPRFNVADVAITVGFGLLLVSMWREEQRAADV